jgi:hypothetical protein
MDGYAVDAAINSKGKRKTTPSEFSFGEYPLLTLTPAGFHFLLEREPDFVPYVSKESFQDKSNANGLAKLLVCAQLLWFC